MDPLSAVTAVKSADEAVGVIEKLLGKLRAQPSIAAVKLSAALDEVRKTYSAVDQAFNAYASLAIDENALTTRSQELFAIAGGSLDVEVEAGRGSSSAIRNIYEKYLKRWFEKAFNQEEYSEIERAFTHSGGLEDADGFLFYVLTGLAGQLKNEAQGVKNLVMEKRFDEARESIRSTTKTLTPVQQEMARAMVRIYKLQGELIQIAQTT
jgi:hypothetical protein